MLRFFNLIDDDFGKKIGFNLYFKKIKIKNPYYFFCNCEKQTMKKGKMRIFTLN